MNEDDREVIRRKILEQGIEWEVSDCEGLSSRSEQLLVDRHQTKNNFLLLFFLLLFLLLLFLSLLFLLLLFLSLLFLLFMLLMLFLLVFLVIGMVV